MPEIPELNAQISFDPETNTYRLDHDWQSDESITTVVTAGVEEVTDIPATDLDLLFETIDPDALEKLYLPSNNGSTRDDGWVSFPFNNCNVTVYATGTIEITPDGDNS